MAFRIEKLGPGDLIHFKELIHLFEEAFEMDNLKLPDDTYLQQLLNKSDFFAFVALSDDEIVGGLTGYTLQQYYSTSPLLYIYDLAVHKTFLRQGIGRLLISELTAFCKENGYEEVFVQADKADEHAISFYNSTGGNEEQVVQFNYPLKG